jgi:hypothetical protein
MFSSIILNLSKSSWFFFSISMKSFRDILYKVDKFTLLADAFRLKPEKKANSPNNWPSDSVLITVFSPLLFKFVTY